jgi:hypothetical protein
MAKNLVERSIIFIKIGKRVFDRIKGENLYFGYFRGTSRGQGEELAQNALCVRDRAGMP